MPDIPEIGKAAGVPCPNLTDQGCGIYDTRPETCRKFECGWKTSERFRTDDRPDSVGILVMGLETPVGNLNVAHELWAGAFDSWKGDRLVKRESKRAVIGLTDFGKPRTTKHTRIAGPKRACAAIDREAKR